MTVRAPVAADDVTVMSASIVVELTTVMFDTLTPEPEIPALTSDYREVRSAAATIARGDDWWERLYGAASASSLEKAD